MQQSASQMFSALPFLSRCSGVQGLRGKCISYVRRKDRMWTQFHQLHFVVSWYCACSKKSLCTGWVFIKSCGGFFVGILISDKPYCNLSQFTECLAYLPGCFTVLPCLEVLMKTYFVSVCYYSNWTYQATPFSQLIWNKANKKSSLQSLTPQLFWLQQLNPMDFAFKNVSESCVWQKRAQPFWDMWDLFPFSHNFTSCGCSNIQTCLLQLAQIPSSLVCIIPEKAVLLAD